MQARLISNRTKLIFTLKGLFSFLEVVFLRVRIGLVLTI
jgi:hypothetical protein